MRLIVRATATGGTARRPRVLECLVQSAQGTVIRHRAQGTRKIARLASSQLPEFDDRLRFLAVDDAQELAVLIREYRRERFADVGCCRNLA